MDSSRNHVHFIPWWSLLKVSSRNQAIGTVSLFSFFYLLLSFYSMLKCLIVPLLVSSIVSAIGSLDLSMSGKIAMRWVFFLVAKVIYGGYVYVCIYRCGKGINFHLSFNNCSIFEILFCLYRACIYYMLTTIFAVILGIILVTTIRPGESAKLAEPTKTVGTTKQVLTQDTLMDLIR